MCCTALGQCCSIISSESDKSTDSDEDDKPSMHLIVVVIIMAIAISEHPIKTLASPANTLITTPNPQEAVNLIIDFKGGLNVHAITPKRAAAIQFWSMANPNPRTPVIRLQLITRDLNCAIFKCQINCFYKPTMRDSSERMLGYYLS